MSLDELYGFNEFVACKCDVDAPTDIKKIVILLKPSGVNILHQLHDYNNGWFDSSFYFFIETLFAQQGWLFAFQEIHFVSGLIREK